MRILTLLVFIPLVGCTFGEAAGLYDVPEDTPIALADAPYPELLTERQIAARGIAPLTTDQTAGEITAANALGAQAAAVLADEAQRIEDRAGSLRQSAGALTNNGPGLTAAGRALLARAARLRARAS